MEISNLERSTDANGQPQSPADIRATYAKVAQRLINSENVFEIVSDDLKTLGFVGDPSHAQALYAVYTSRVLNEPMSAVIRAPSSSGKSWLLNNALKFIPSEAYELKSGMSPTAIAYGESDLRHKILCVQEASGLGGREGNKLVRTLISEKFIEWEVTERHGDKFKVRIVKREGPIAFVISTTETCLNSEDESRALSIEVDDTPEHTRRVIIENAQRHAGLSRENDVDLSEHIAFQHWIEQGPIEVVIPFAPQLSKKLQVVANRTKRDFEHVMSAIKVSTILHQAHRELDSNGRLIATLDDYAMVRAFLAPIVNEVTAAIIPTTVRETVEAIRTLGGDGTQTPEPQFVQGPTLAALRKKMGELDMSSVSRRVDKAKRLGFVVDLKRGNGHPSNLVVVMSLPSDCDVLPLVEDLVEEMDDEFLV